MDDNYQEFFATYIRNGERHHAFIGTAEGIERARELAALPSGVTEVIKVVPTGKPPGEATPEDMGLRRR